MRLVYAALLLLTLVPSAEGRLLFGSRRGSTIALRRRLHVNSLITEPGTVEVEWNNTLDLTNDAYWTMPSTIKYTPEGRDLLWGRTEYSTSFDGFLRDRVTVAANTLLRDGEHFDATIQPQFTYLFGTDTGYRAGATAIGRLDWGRNSAGLTLSWSGANHPSPTNPAGVFDLTTGLGRHIRDTGILGHVTVHGDVQFERQTGTPSTVSVFEGFEYQITEKIAVDVSGQHYSLWGGPVDHELVIGVTANLGHVRHRH